MKKNLILGLVMVIILAACGGKDLSKKILNPSGERKNIPILWKGSCRMIL